MTSPVGSSISSRITVSRIASRVNSEGSLCELGGKLTETIEQIKLVTDSHESVLAFFYRNSPTEVRSKI